MQAAVEITEAHPTSCNDGSKLASPTGRLPVSQPFPENGGSTFKPQDEGRSPSGKGFLKKKFPLWLKRKGPANSPQGLAVSRSRLCMEATHESPIQAVRKPTQRGALCLDTKEDSAPEKTGPSLLRKLWCLKATDAKLKKPPFGSEASPLQRARCGPVAALSRAADPHGESPLRWKPRGETQSPEEPEQVETVSRPGASWLAKPWRTFRAMLAARAKKASVLSGSHRNPGATGERVLCLPTELEASPATEADRPVGEPPNVGAVDKTPPPTPPSVAGELCGSQEDEGANGTPQHRLESHRRMEAMPRPVPKLPIHEKNGCHEDNPILEVVSELEGVPTEVGHLPGRNLEAGGAATEEEGSGQGDDGYWVELSAGEDLAELAENPGGQGMVMATRGWLTSEGLGGPKAEGKAAASIRSHPNGQGMEQETVVWADSPQGSEDSDERASGVSLDKTSRAGCWLPPALSENGTSSAVTCHRSGITTVEAVGTSCSASLREMILSAPLEPCPSSSSREFKRGAEGNLASVPVRTAALDLLGGNGSSPGSLSGQWLPSPTESHGAVPWQGTTGPEEKQKRLIYVAAVEIVEAAIDAAAEQLAKKREREIAGQRGPADGTANCLAGDARRQCGWLA